MQHDIAGGSAFEPFVRNGGAGDVAAQVFEFAALMGAEPHRGMQSEAVLVGAAWWCGIRLSAWNGSQGEHFLPRPRPKRNAVSTRGCLQGCERVIGSVLKLVNLTMAPQSC